MKSILVVILGFTWATVLILPWCWMINFLPFNGMTIGIWIFYLVFSILASSIKTDDYSNPRKDKP